MPVAAVLLRCSYCIVTHSWAAVILTFRKPNPVYCIGKSYRQEYYAGKAEDMADLLSASASVTVPYGSFDNVVQTKDYTPLEPDLCDFTTSARDLHNFFIT